MVRFISAQPATLYYAWQVEVMLHSFLKAGINLNYVDILISAPITEKMPENWLKLAQKYPARFFQYPDTRINPKYISSIRPHIIKKHFKNNPNLKKETIFYHDSDIALTKPINLKQFEEGNDWYGSDCRWYLGYDYILSKGEDVLNAMSTSCSINPHIIKENELNSIGAQYIMKNLDADFWNEVEENSEKMFNEITELNNQKKLENPHYHEVQIWCADMWALLWAAWKRGIKTNCHPDLKFSWATSTGTDWERYAIFHNAGVANRESELFYKADFINELPYGKDIKVKTGTTSHRYWELIQEVGLNTVLTN